MDAGVRVGLIKLIVAVDHGRFPRITALIET
jgi:hypothetical protein